MKFLFNLIRGIRGLLLPFLVFGSVPNVLAQEMFSIPAPTNLVKSLAVDGIQALSTDSTVSTQDTQTTDLNLPGNIYGLAITASFGLRIAFGGNFQPDDPSAFVRVVLIDNDTQQEYLVYQKNYQDLTTEEYNTPTQLTVNAICQETCIFPQAVSRDQSATLRVQARHGQIIVSNISYLDAPISGVDATELRRQQNAVVIQKLNEQNLGWIAGETSVSNLTYAEKKRLVNLTDPSQELNLQGFEYYRGGVFELKSKDTTGSVHRGTRQSTLVDNFDWGNQHGKSWVTEVRDQYPCGSCYAHSSIGTVEAVAKLYFNDSQWDLNLSEQDVLSCGGTYSTGGEGVSFDGTCSSGGNGYLVLKNYVAKNGVVDEECFKYQETQNAVGVPYQPCSLKCTNPKETIQISGVATPFSQTPPTEEALKKVIIENGPVDSGIKSLGHAMLLVGFEKDPNDKRTIWIFKNSWGGGWGGRPLPTFTDEKTGKVSHWGVYQSQGKAENGYAYIKLEVNNIVDVSIAELPVTSSAQRQISCVDQDLDTYCNWGISKDQPTTCPASCKLEKDCDDSDPKKGPFDADYNCPNTNKDPVQQSPVATFTLSPTAGTAPLTVTLDASASKDPDGTLVSYDWSTGVAETPIGTGNPFTYTIGTAGQTVITLVVKDNQGLAAKDKKVVTVTPAQQLTLQVNKNGTGDVTSLDGRINCGTTCTHNYSNVIPVTLRAQIANDLEVKWGDCLTNSTDPKTCEVTMDANKTVTATFSQKSVSQLIDLGTLAIETPADKTINTFGVNSQGNTIVTDAVLKGGISIKGSAFVKTVTALGQAPEAPEHQTDSVLVKGSIQVDSKHEGQPIEIFAYGEYLPDSTNCPDDLNNPSFNAQVSYYIMEQLPNHYKKWEGPRNPATLTFINDYGTQTLTRATPKEFTLFGGGGISFDAKGCLSISFGYRAQDGTVIYNHHTATVDNTIQVMVRRK